MIIARFSSICIYRNSIPLSLPIEFVLSMKAIFQFFIRSKTRALIFAIVWTLIIFTACLIPSRDVPEVDLPLIDKWVHFVIFGGFSFLWLATFREVNVQKCFVIFLCSVAVGYVVELLQGSGITTGRSYDLMDVVADAVGGALGAIVFYGMDKIYVKAKRPADS